MRGATQNLRERAPQKIKSTYFRDHATPYECFPLPHSLTPRQPIRRIARPPTPQLSLRFDLRATHARTLLPAAFASMPVGFVLVRVRVLRVLERPFSSGISSLVPQPWRCLVPPLGRLYCLHYTSSMPLPKANAPTSDSPLPGPTYSMDRKADS
jgi:hypothetical protein